MQGRDPCAGPEEKADKDRVRGSMFLKRPKPTPQQISHITQQLRLEKDVV